MLDVVHELQPIFECLSLLQKLYNFVSCASIHPIWVHLQEERNLKVMELKAISETRWSCQSNMLSTVCSRVDVLFGLLEIVSNRHHRRKEKIDTYNGCAMLYLRCANLAQLLAQFQYRVVLARFSIEYRACALARFGL